VPEHYKFVGEDGVDCDVPLGSVVMFSFGLSKVADSSVGLWRDAATGMLNMKRFEHSSLIPFRPKFQTFDQVKFADPRIKEPVFVQYSYCSLRSGEWIYGLSTGTEHPETELVGVPKATTELPNVVEKRDNLTKWVDYATAYGGDFSTAYASEMRAYHAAQVYGNWGPIRDPFRAVQAGQPIQAGDAVSVNGVTGRAVPANQMVGRVVRMPAYYPDSGFNTNSYSHLILWRPE